MDLCGDEWAVRNLGDQVVDARVGSVTGAGVQADDQVELPPDDHWTAFPRGIGPVVTAHPQPWHDLVPGGMWLWHAAVLLTCLHLRPSLPRQRGQLPRPTTRLERPSNLVPHLGILRTCERPSPDSVLRPRIAPSHDKGRRDERAST